MAVSTLAGPEVEISWDRMDKRQIEDAKAVYMAARRDGRRIVDAEGREVEGFHPDHEYLLVKEAALADGEVAVRILDETGDRRLVWNANDPEQVKEVFGRFNDYIKAGCKIYAIDKNGNKGRRLYAFDADAQEVIVDERGTKEILGDFVKAFRAVTVLPKTYPG